MHCEALIAKQAPLKSQEKSCGFFPDPMGGTFGRTLMRAFKSVLPIRNCGKKSATFFYSVHGIGTGVWGLREMDILNPADGDGFADAAELYMVSEGAAELRMHLRRERSKSLVDRFKSELKSFSCSVCDFDFSQKYGELGRRFIEAHHKLPISQLEPSSMTKLEDLAAVCSNCHSMLHRAGGISIADLKARILVRTT